MPIVLKSGNLNLLEPSGPVQACNGIALPLPIYTMLWIRATFLWPTLYLCDLTASHFAVGLFTVIVSHLYMPREAPSLLRYPSFPLSGLLTLTALLVFKLQLLLQGG